MATGFLLPIPAFFFDATNLTGKVVRVVAMVVCPVAFGLATATLMFGVRDIFLTINNAIIVALVVIAI